MQAQARQRVKKNSPNNYREFPPVCRDKLNKRAGGMNSTMDRHLVSILTFRDTTSCQNAKPPAFCFLLVFLYRLCDQSQPSSKRYPATPGTLADSVLLLPISCFKCRTVVCCVPCKRFAQQQPMLLFVTSSTHTPERTELRAHKRSTFTLV